MSLASLSNPARASVAAMTKTGSKRVISNLQKDKKLRSRLHSRREYVTVTGAVKSLFSSTPAQLSKKLVPTENPMPSGAGICIRAFVNPAAFTVTYLLQALSLPLSSPG
jgi:hypothetical protein